MGADQSRGLQMGTGLPYPSPISNLSAVIKNKTPWNCYREREKERDVGIVLFLLQQTNLRDSINGEAKDTRVESRSDEFGGHAEDSVVLQMAVSVE